MKVESIGLIEGMTICVPLGTVQRQNINENFENTHQHKK